MLRLRIAVQLRSLNLPFKQALATARRLGVEAVEIDARGELTPQALGDTGIRQIRKLLDDYELRAAAVEFRTRRGYNVTDELDRRVEATKSAMRFAYALGASVVTNHIGKIPDDVESAEWRLMVEVLTDLATFGQRVGALICAETGVDSGPDIARLLAALPEGLVGVTLDPGNLIVSSFAPLDVIEAVGAAIHHVHVNDAVTDVHQGRGMQVEIGRGEADFPALLAALEERHYQGYLSIERPTSHDAAGEIARAVQFLRSL
ncbi:MAG TPA: sugar phosphate isomerase/epimerase family protein [Pirellulales bacterium]|nr:sugar phosphate isomerase/epimerase family protein [Pirellulales bacterium]